MAFTKDDVYKKLSTNLQDLFEIPAGDIRPDAKLFEDLDLDSIDAIDLLAELQHFTNKKISPENFRTVSTVQDVVDKIVELANEENCDDPQ